VLGFSVRFTVEKKGAIDLSVTGSRECLPGEQAATLTFPSFTVTGGSGIYAGATGNGTLQEMFVPGAISAHGKDIWTGTLIVSGLDFDLVAPTIGGAGDKVVRARRGVTRTRVTYKLSAVDAIDGPVAVACTPKSGTRFKSGRTRVRCSAMDGSGNAQTATFTVIVKARR
jgi:HYR domain